MFSDDVSLIPLDWADSQISDKDVAVDGSGVDCKDGKFDSTNADLTGAKSGNYSITDQPPVTQKFYKKTSHYCDDVQKPMVKPWYSETVNLLLHPKAYISYESVASVSLTVK